MTPQNQFTLIAPTLETKSHVLSLMSELDIYVDSKLKASVLLKNRPSLESKPTLYPCVGKACFAPLAGKKILNYDGLNRSIAK